MTNHWWERIHYDPLVMSGTPLVHGVPVWQVMQRLADTLSVDEVRRLYPHLTTDDVRAVLAYAAASAGATPRESGRWTTASETCAPREAPLRTMSALPTGARDSAAHGLAPKNPGITPGLLTIFS